MGIAVCFKWNILEAVPLPAGGFLILTGRSAGSTFALLAAKYRAMRIMRCIVTTAIISLAAIPVLMLSL